MADKSQIEWTDATWNPVTGCSKVSQGCKNCYALRDWARLSAPRPKPNIYTGRKFTDVQCHPARLDQPLRWKRPRRVFVNSMSDLFHESVPDLFISDVLWTIEHSQHTFQVLTKRPARMAKLLPEFYPGDPLPNLWLGVSVENQETANERIPLLLGTPAVVRFLSCEPLLGPVDLRSFDSEITVDWLRGEDGCEPAIPGIDWVIAGGESGPNARHMHPDWARGLRDQCRDSGVAFHFKQWGEWAPNFARDGRVSFQRVGKKTAGRELDGRTWDEYPTAA